MTETLKGAVPMAGLWRAGRLESEHYGHAVVCDAKGEIVAAWGDPAAVIYPRSSCKMVQALPLLESGAGGELSDRQLALACASHQGAAMHTEVVARWLSDMGLGEADLRCGSHEPRDLDARDALIRADQGPCQLHNNCSGKHAGFLALNQHLRGDPEYVAPDHPVQKAVRAAFEDVTGAESPGFGIDGCSAPNFATSLLGLARAMAFFASADPEGDARNRAAVRLWQAMAQHPELVAGEGRACTDMMRAMNGQVVVKTGAEAVFVAIVPKHRLGLAIKIVDGATRASELAVAAILVRLGVLDPAHPVARRHVNGSIRNWRGTVVGEMRPAPGLV